MLKECIYAQSELQHFGRWNRLEKLALIFLYNFDRKRGLIKLIRKKLSPKINVKNIKNRVCLYPMIQRKSIPQTSLVISTQTHLHTRNSKNL